MNHFSFLIGAGFSKPAGYPLATEINKKFKNLTNQDFFICTAKEAKQHIKEYKTRGILNLRLINNVKFKNWWHKIK